MIQLTPAAPRKLKRAVRKERDCPLKRPKVPAAVDMEDGAG